MFSLSLRKFFGFTPLPSIAKFNIGKEVQAAAARVAPSSARIRASERRASR